MFVAADSVPQVSVRTGQHHATWHADVNATPRFCVCRTASSLPFIAAVAGDVVKEDDVIAQIEADKVTIDVKFTGKAGKITTLAVAEGDTVVVGQKVAEVEEGDFGGSAPAAAAAPEPEAAAAAPPPPSQQPAAAAAQPPSPPPTSKAQSPAAPKVSCPH